MYDRQLRVSSEKHGMEVDRMGFMKWRKREDDELEHL